MCIRQCSGWGGGWWGGGGGGGEMSAKYSACCLVRPWMEELIPEKTSLEKIPKPHKRWMGRPQLLPEIVENVLRSLWWGNGSKQPSPCLQPPKVGGLLRHLLLLLKAPLTSLHFWSQIYMDFSQFWFRFSMLLVHLPHLLGDLVGPQVHHQVGLHTKFFKVFRIFLRGAELIFDQYQLKNQF